MRIDLTLLALKDLFFISIHSNTGSTWLEGVQASDGEPASDPSLSRAGILWRGNQRRER